MSEGLHFEISVDNSNFRQKIEEVRKGVENTANVFKKLGGAMNTKSAEDNLTKLQTKIAQNEGVLRELNIAMQEYVRQANEAAAMGDKGLFDVITKDIEDQLRVMTQVTEETEQYRQALSSIEGATGVESTQAGDVSAVQYYASEEDYNRVKDLRAAIEDVQQQISMFSGSEEELNALRVRLTDLNDELRSSEQTAAQAAASLGTDLGARAAATSTQLYELNDAIEKQKTTIADLEEKTDAARAAFDALDASADPVDVETARVAYENLANQLQNATNELLNMEAAQTDVRAAMSNVSQEANAQDSFIVKLIGGFKEYKGAVSALPAPLRAAVTGIQGMTTAAKAFMANPIGLAIAAITAAVVACHKAMTSWFTSTKEGQMAMAQVTGYVSGVFKQLKEIAIAVGKALYTAFTDPKEAAKDLLDFLKSQVIVRVQSLGDMFVALGGVISSALRLDTEGMKSNLSDMSNAFSDWATGVENSAEKIGNWATKVGDAAKATAELNQREKQLQLDESTWAVRSQELEKQMSVQQAKMRDTNASSASRKAAYNEYKKLLDEQMAGERKLADERVAIQKGRMALTSNTIEDEVELNNLIAARAALDTREQQRITALSRTANSIFRQTTTDDGTLALRRKNIQAEIDLMEEGIEKKKAIIKRDYEQQAEEIAKAAKKMADANKKNGVSGNANGLTDEQQAEIDKATENNTLARAKAEQDLVKAEAQAMRDYLKEYGSYQQKKLAIAEEYAERIKQASTEGEKLSLEKERDLSMQQVEIDAIKQQIDWGSVFGNFGTMFADQLQPTIDALKAIANSEEYKGASVTEQQALWDVIRGLESSQSQAWDSDAWGAMVADLETYQYAMDKLNKAMKDEKTAADNLVQAQNALADAITDEEKAKAEEDVVDAQKKLTAASNTTIQAQKNASDATAQLQTSSEQLVGQFVTLNEGLQLLSSGSLQGAFNGIMKFVSFLNEEAQAAVNDALTNLVDKMLGSKLTESLQQVLGNSGLIGSLISAILAIFDTIAEEGIGGIVAGLIDSILGAVDGILEDILHGRIVTSIADSLIDNVGSIFDTISFGGFSSLFGASGNSERVTKAIESLEESNENLEDAIDDLKDTLSDALGIEAIETGQEALELQKEEIENAMEEVMLAMSYHASHHSNSYYWDWSTEQYEAMNDALEEWAEKNNEIASEVWSLKDIYELSPEELNYIRTYYSDIWDDIVEEGKYDKSEYWEAYADLAGSLEEIQDAVDEALTGTTFEGLRSSLIDTLMDMESDVDDAMDDITEIMMEALLSAQLSNYFDEYIQDWYDKFADYLENAENNELTDAQISELSDEWESIVEDAYALRDKLAAATGYDSSSTEQEATRNGVETITVDQADELIGRATAMQIAINGVATQAVAGVTMLTTMSSTMTAANSTLTSILNQTVVANGYLEDIYDYSKKKYTLLSGEFLKAVKDIQSRL